MDFIAYCTSQSCCGANSCGKRLLENMNVKRDVYCPHCGAVILWKQKGTRRRNASEGRNRMKKLDTEVRRVR